MEIHLIISSLRGGGAERVLALLATSFAKNPNLKITIITLNKGEEYSINNDKISKTSLSHGKIKNHTIRSFVNLFRFYKTKNNRPDIIISFITLTNFITIPIAKLFSIKIIAAEHNSYLRVMKNRKFLSDFTREQLYKKADLVTVLTSFDLPYYTSHGVNVKVMPNPCSFKPMDTKGIKREKTILAIGSLDRYHHKGFDNLIDFIKPILEANEDWTLKIVGNGDKGLAYLSEKVKKAGFENQIIFTGFIDNVSELMQKSSIFILPSRFEGLPMVLLEAMSQGMACIAYNCKTGPSDIITNNINGFLIEDQNEEEMSNKLIALIDDVELRKTFGNKAIYSLEKYDIINVTEDYINIFKKLIT